MIAICERTSIEITLENATNYAVYALLRLTCFECVKETFPRAVSFTRPNLCLIEKTLMIIIFWGLYNICLPTYNLKKVIIRNKNSGLKDFELTIFGSNYTCYFLSSVSPITLLHLIFFCRI